MLSSVMIGDRVVVRRHCGSRDGRPRFTDVIGLLRARDEVELHVERDSGELVVIPATEVVAAKAIPPKPVSYRRIAAVERACAATWPATESARLGEWQLRAADGWTNRANTALPLGDPGMPLTDAIDAVSQWYAQRGLPPGFAVPLPLARRVATALEARGWRRLHTVEVLVAPMTSSPRPPDGPVELASALSPAWSAVAAGVKGGFPPAAMAVLGSGADRVFASVTEAGHTVAIGRGAIAAEVAVLSLISVAESARRRGLARRVMAALAGWAAGQGAGQLCVQVLADNAAALRLYDTLGFRFHHRYVDLRP
jgi:GNAT superfamily N-acetyltransferase